MIVITQNPSNNEGLEDSPNPTLQEEKSIRNDEISNDIDKPEVDEMWKELFDE